MIPEIEGGGGIPQFFTWESDRARLTTSTLPNFIFELPSDIPIRRKSGASVKFRQVTQGKSVTFGVTLGCIAVASPVSSITWLISP